MRQVHTPKPIQLADFPGLTPDAIASAQKIGITRAILYQRLIVHDWPIEEALTVKPRPRAKKQPGSDWRSISALLRAWKPLNY
jgi:hypothetical protein